MAIVLGIDLGTTYSCVSYIDSSGKPVVIKNSEGELTTPSVVFFESENNVVVGTAAKESAKLYPNEVVSYVKRSMGSQGTSWFIQNAHRSPEEVSSYILKKLVSDACEVLRSENKLKPGEEIKDVVITCPAYYGINERESTKKAGELAGLNVLNIINEPTAAAITYGVLDSPEKNNVVLVYDLGGGTFDITMINISPGDIKVICTGGDHSLGGKMWDDRIIEYVADEFARQTGNTDSILEDPETLQELAISAERAKKMLTAREKAPISINYKGQRARVEISREQFCAMTADLVERTIMLTNEIFEEADKKGYKHFEIAEILLVGGSTRMPQIARRIEEEYKIPVKIYDPDEAVAKGAALFGERQSFYGEVIEKTAQKTGRAFKIVENEIKSGKSDIKKLAENVSINTKELSDAASINIVNVTSRSFGTLAFESSDPENKKEVLYNMIIKNTELPVFEARRFYTLVDNQKHVNIKVLESLSSERYAQPDEGTEIGEAVLELPNGLPAGSPLEIEFCLTEAGLLELKAKELAENKEVSTRFETTDAISQQELDAAKERVQATDVD